MLGLKAWATTHRTLLLVFIFDIYSFCGACLPSACVASSGQRTSCGSCSPSTVWVSGMELRSAGLEAKAFTSPAPGPVFSTEEPDPQRRRGLQKIPEPRRRLQVWPDQSNLLSLMLSGLPCRLSAPGKQLHHKPCAETFVIQAEIRGPCF